MKCLARVGKTQVRIIKVFVHNFDDAHDPSPQSSLISHQTTYPPHKTLRTLRCHDGRSIEHTYQPEFLTAVAPPATRRVDERRMQLR